MLAPKATLGPEAIEAYAAYLATLCEDSFYAYRQCVNPKFVWNWFTRDLATRLRRFYQEFEAGRRPILCIHTPPQHSKSMTVLDFAAWLAGRRPRTQMVYASFSDRLGVRANLRMQRALEREVYRRAFPDCKLNPLNTPGALRNHEILEFVGSDGGLWRNTTVKGSITGEGFDLMIVDDPVKGRAEANSKIERDRIWSWFTDDLLTRQSELGALLFIGTRWHIDDPAGRLLERFGDRVKVLRYPALAEVDDSYRKCGEPLFPQLKSAAFLAERYATLSQSSWQALYQQTPVTVGGGLFPVEKLAAVPTVDRTNLRRSVRYWDKAGTAGGDGAYTAGVLMHVLNDGSFVIEHIARGRWAALERESKIRAWAEADRSNCKSYEVGVEQEPGSGGKDSAEATIRNLSGFKVFADKVTGSKETRAEPFAAQVQGGNVKLLQGSWNYELLDEMEAFPNGRFRDQCDACAGAFNRLTQGARYNLDALAS